MAEPTKQPTADEIAHGMGVLVFTEPDSPRREYLAAIHALALEALDLRAQLENCETCQGTGIMQVLDHVIAPTEEEVYAPEPCAACGGDGKSGYVKLRAQVRRLEEERDEARRIAYRFWDVSIGWNEIVSADAEIVQSWSQEGDGQ